MLRHGSAHIPSGLLSYTGLNSSNASAFELVSALLSFGSSNPLQIPVAAATCPPAEPPPAAILSRINTKPITHWHEPIESQIFRPEHRRLDLYALSGFHTVIGKKGDNASLGKICWRVSQTGWTEPPFHPPPKKKDQQLGS